MTTVDNAARNGTTMYDTILLTLDGTPTDPAIIEHVKLIFYSLGMSSARKPLISLRVIVGFFKM